jgi:5'-deoxynucleotidase YfbR-like HD superfamily hydrolase
MSNNIISEIFSNPIYDQTNNMVRWNGMHRIKDETVGHHTHIVTFFTRIILEELFHDYPYESTKNKVIADTMTYAIFHDFDESFTGDIIHTFKHNKFNGEQIRLNTTEYLNHVRDNIDVKTSTHLMLKEFAFGPVGLKQFQKDIVKISDWLSMMFYLKKESDLGNKLVIEKIIYCSNELLKVVSTLQSRVSQYMRKDVDFTIVSNLVEFLNNIKNG